jgi:hypothetical protein
MWTTAGESGRSSIFKFLRLSFYSWTAADDSNRSSILKFYDRSTTFKFYVLPSVLEQLLAIAIAHQYSSFTSFFQFLLVGGLNLRPGETSLSADRRGTEVLLRLLRGARGGLALVGAILIKDLSCTGTTTQSPST